MKTLGDLWHAIKGLDEDTKYSLTHISQFVSPEEQQMVQYLVKYRKAAFDDHVVPVSARVLPDAHYPQLIAKTDDAEHKAFIEQVNAAIAEAATAEHYGRFSKKALSFLSTAVAPHLVGLDTIREAVALQLVMPERFHILLLGDPGTGKTDILRGAADLAPISSFGLGSGSSKAGLAAVAVGKAVHKGLLPLASGGVCCIDELNLMKIEDRAALYNAMEKGFVTYDKGALHTRFDADIRLLATANPRGDQFRGTGLEAVKKQLPFDAALLSRFHLTFLVRKPSKQAFREITTHALGAKPKPLSTHELAFIHAYVAHAKAITVALDKRLQAMIVDEASRYKDRERELLTDVTPRLAYGIAALAKAFARIELRDAATDADVQRAFAIVAGANTV